MHKELNACAKPLVVGSYLCNGMMVQNNGFLCLFSKNLILPVDIAEYVTARGIDKEPAFAYLVGPLYSAQT
jgi:hypothetical protein